MKTATKSASKARRAPKGSTRKPWWHETPSRESITKLVDQRAKELGIQFSYPLVEASKRKGGYRLVIRLQEARLAGQLDALGLDVIFRDGAMWVMVKE